MKDLATLLPPGGRGVIATAGADGAVNVAVYARPRITDEGELAWGMTEGRTFANLRENKKVSFGIAEPYDSRADFFGNKGVQAWGTARVYGMKDDPAQFSAALKKMNAAKGHTKIEIKNLLPRFNYRIIEIAPDKIRYGNPREGVFQVTWQKQ